MQKFNIKRITLTLATHRKLVCSFVCAFTVLAQGLSFLSSSVAVGQTSHTLQTQTVKPYALLESALTGTYSRQQQATGYTIHYEPHSYVSTNITQTLYDLQWTSERVSQVLGTKLRVTFDVYLADYFFAPPDLHLRGRTFSARRQIFLLVDGSGSDNERRYLFAHELTHLIAWNAFGRPGSAMVSEGLAVYAGQIYWDAAGFLPLAEICLAYKRAGQLPRMSSRFTTYLGHLVSLDSYSAAGCFVDYLIRTYGMSKFQRVYSTLNWEEIYGKSLNVLEDAWLSSLEQRGKTILIDSTQWMLAYAQLTDDYRALFAAVEANQISTGDMTRYKELDARRMAILKGRLDVAPAPIAVSVKQ